MEKKTNLMGLPDKINSIRISNEQFKNKLIQKPSWLNEITDNEAMNGLTIERVELQKWTKFLVYLNPLDFNGLNKIEINNESIIYMFEKGIVYSREELNKREERSILGCQKARALLQEKGFVIDNSEPIRGTKPHYGIYS